MKRVVITGMGVVSPNGIGRKPLAAPFLRDVRREKRSRDSIRHSSRCTSRRDSGFDELAWAMRAKRKHVRVRCR